MDITSDKLREECGVVALYGHPEASKLAYLSLYALQHRGQESAGIAASDGDKLQLHKSMGLVSDIFNADVLSRLPGSLAIGHTRYSTTGDSALLNAQPIMVECNKGKSRSRTTAISLMRLRFADNWSRPAPFSRPPATPKSLFTSSRARGETLADAMADSLRRLEGAFSLVMLTPDRVFAARDPRGFRPLVMGRIPGHAVIAPTLSCSLPKPVPSTLVGANYEREVKPGELVIVGAEGVHSRFYAAQQPLSSCVFEHVYFSRPDSLVFGRAVQQTRDAMGRQLAKESPVDAEIVVPVPDSGVTAAMGFSHESGIPLQFGLIRNHYVGRPSLSRSSVSAISV